MRPSIPQTMKAAAIDRFGGPEVLGIKTLPVPQPDEEEILIHVDAAGVGVWDPWEREGELAEGETTFPHVLGSDGAGEVVAVGRKVDRFRVGDRVYAFGFGNPKGGFYAEYAAVKASLAARIPKGMTVEEAGALAADGITALRGLRDHLQLKQGQRLLVYGASGGVGHIALQLARRMGAKVLAVASGEDGVALARQLGADAAVEGHSGDVAGACRDFAPQGLDAALVLACGETCREALSQVRPGGRVAWPNGVEPQPEAPEGVQGVAYDGVPSQELLEQLNALIESGPFHLEVSRLFPMEEVARAHEAVFQHHLGKLALRIH